MKGGTDTPTMGASQADWLPPRARNGSGQSSVAPPVFGLLLEADSPPPGRDGCDEVNEGSPS